MCDVWNFKHFNVECEYQNAKMTPTNLSLSHPPADVADPAVALPRIAVQIELLEGFQADHTWNCEPLESVPVELKRSELAQSPESLVVNVMDQRGAQVQRLQLLQRRERVTGHCLEAVVAEGEGAEIADLVENSGREGGKIVAVEVEFA